MSIPLPRLEDIIGPSGIAPRIEALLPTGVRCRQLRVSTLILGMMLTHADRRPAHLTGVHAALTALSAADQRLRHPFQGQRPNLPLTLILQMNRHMRSSTFSSMTRAVCAHGLSLRFTSASCTRSTRRAVQGWASKTMQTALATCAFHGRRSDGRLGRS
jgi:hypothetical protein